MEFDLLLNNISRHIQLDRAETDFFLSLLQIRKISKKEFLLKQGEICRTENFILKGCLRVYSIDVNGFEHILMFGIEDWWVSDLYSFLTNAPSTYNIDALEETVVVQITKAKLDRLYEQIPKFERFFRLILQNAYIAQQQRLNQNLSLNAEHRYLNLIQKYPAFEQRIPQKQLAAYLGITPVFLSMLRKKLSRK
ncbi:MAG TPA: Crp/Fnr family transcriptional regulator [Sphingobacteriaceae bacterium]